MNRMCCYQSQFNNGEFGRGPTSFDIWRRHQRSMIIQNQPRANENGAPHASLYNKGAKLSTVLTSRAYYGRAETNSQVYDSKPEECRASNFYYCCSDELCYPKKSDALDCFIKGCRSFCGIGSANRNGSYCEERGCVYNSNLRTCRGPQTCERIAGVLANECIEAGCNYCCLSSICQTNSGGSDCINKLPPNIDSDSELKITIYEHINFLGTSYTYNGFEYCKGCRNLPSTLVNRLSGINTNGICVRLYTDSNCRGTTLNLTGAHGDFTRVLGQNVNDKLNSLSLC
ncbi:unnamed protein product [Orchesella dallaii]|uniref:Uncharacterized protein n=1 Tax=Orchesella dallaii TaxID=48710 RepID=A0ABP1QZH9_9HEXA